MKNLVSGEEAALETVVILTGVCVCVCVSAADPSAACIKAGIPIPLLGSG